MPSPIIQNKAILRIGILCCAVSSFFHKFSPKKNILLLKDDGLGDLIFWLPYQQEIRKHFPRSQYRITLFVKPGFAPLAAASGSIDKVLKFPAYRSDVQWLLFRIFFWLTHAYDIICDLTAFDPENRPGYCIWDHYKKSFLLTLVSCSSQPSERNLKGYFNHIVNADGISIHARFQAVLAGLGISSVPEKIDYMQFCAPFAGIPEQKSFFTVCIGASDSRRTWEQEKFIELICKLQKTYGLTAVLVGDSKERETCEEIRKNCEETNKILNLAGKVSVPQLFTVIRDARFLISNETGPSHIGAVLGVPTFIICGFGDYGDFVPYPDEMEGKTVHSVFSSKRTCTPCQWRNEQCRKSAIYPCISDISVGEVLNVVQSSIPVP